MFGRRPASSFAPGSDGAARAFAGDAASALSLIHI